MIRTVFFSLAVVGLAACGGGGDVAGDVSGFSVIPSGYIAKCSVGEGFINFPDTIHIVNGGQPPFKVTTTTRGVSVGYVDANNMFVAAENPYELMLTGKDPKFAVRFIGARCGATYEGTVVVLDYHSNTVRPTYTAEAAEEE